MNALIHNLGIDWKMLLAQVVNFTLLLIILKKYAYGPVVRALDARRARIQDALERSKQVDERMEQIETLKQEVLDKARKESEEIIKKAEESAAKVQEEILSQTQDRSERLIREAEKRVQAEREKIFSEVKREIAGLVALSIEKTMGDALDGDSRKKLLEHTLQIMETGTNT